MLKKSQLNQESNIFHSKRNILNTIKSKELKEFHTKDKSLNTKKSPEPKEFQLKELSLTIMQFKLKSNISQKKSNKPSLNTNQSKEFGKEFNIFQLKLKLSTILKETITSRAQVNTFKLDMLKELLDTKLLINKVQLMFHLKVELELKLYIKLVMSQLEDQLLDKEVLFLEVKLNMFLEVNPNMLLDKPNMFLDQHIQLEPLILQDKLTLLEEVELEDKTSTEQIGRAHV